MRAVTDRYLAEMTSFDLRRVKLRPGEQYRSAMPIRLEPLELGGQRYAPAPAEPEAALTLTRTPQGYVLELAFAACLDGPCVRCLEPASIDVPIHAREYHEGKADSEELRTPYLVDDRLDLSSWARDAVALALPDKILCSRECAGLCAGCGANLNSDACRCGPPEPDARWGKLAELRERLQG
jgi:uncharacterized protein